MANQKKRTANPFFDLTIGGQTDARVITTCKKRGGRIVMELYAETTPKTAGNFRAIRTGMKGTGKVGKPLHCKGKNLPKNRKKKKAANRKVFFEGLNLNKTVEGSVPADPAPAGPAGSSSGRNKTVEGSVPAVPAPAVPNIKKNKNHLVFFEGLDLNKTVEGSVPAPAGPQSMSSVNCNLGL